MIKHEKRKRGSNSRDPACIVLVHTVHRQRPTPPCELQAVGVGSRRELEEMIETAEDFLTLASGRVPPKALKELAAIGSPLVGGRAWKSRRCQFFDCNKMFTFATNLKSF